MEGMIKNTERPLTHTQNINVYMHKTCQGSFLTARQTHLQQAGRRRSSLLRAF